MCDRYSVFYDGKQEDFNDYEQAEGFFDVMKETKNGVIIYDNIKHEEIMEYKQL